VIDQIHTTRSEAETIELARKFAARLSRGDVVALSGNLGSGKTRFVQGVCDAFGVRSHVSSPTFVILNRYEGLDDNGDEILIHHFDLYRISSTEEVYDLGYEEFFAGDGICLIEWADYLGELLPPQRYDVYLTLGEAADVRTIEIRRVSIGPTVGADAAQRVMHVDSRH